MKRRKKLIKLLTKMDESGELTQPLAVAVTNNHYISVQKIRNYNKKEGK